MTELDTLFQSKGNLITQKEIIDSKLMNVNKRIVELINIATQKEEVVKSVEPSNS